jgi:hypothetical protein
MQREEKRQGEFHVSCRMLSSEHATAQLRAGYELMKSVDEARQILCKCLFIYSAYEIYGHERGRGVALK